MGCFLAPLCIPVACLIPFGTEADALRIANDSDFGLVAGVWTQNVARAHRMASRLQAGQVYINNYQGVNIEAPFGGYKHNTACGENQVDACFF